MFLLPGAAIVTAILRKREMPAGLSLIAAIVASAACGYVAFWIYFASKLAGQIFSYGVVVAALVALARRRKQEDASRKQELREAVVPLLYAFCLGVFYLSLLYLFVNPMQAGVDVANVRFFPETRPGDNIIPFIFAERIYDRAPIRPFCCGDWLSSDRPPLQAGIFLLQRPLRVAGNTGLQYQVLGTMLQCLWVCGVWSVLRALGAGMRRCTQVLCLLGFSGFLFYNSVYVWPKLLAAAFILFVFAILARAILEPRALRRFEIALAASSFVLALLAHPGSVFSTPAIVVALLWKRDLLRWKQAALALPIFVAAIVPWMLYQKFYDPPGNRLLKMHLAGVMEPDPRSTFQALQDAYGGLSVGKIFRNKAANLESAVGIATWKDLRIAEREYIPWAIGVLNLGWVLLLRRRLSVFAAQLGWIIGAAALNLLVWCIVLFGPGYAVTEDGSYADILLLSIALAGFVLAARRFWPLILVAQAINLIFVWVLFRPESFTLPSRVVAAPSLQWPMLVLAVLFGLAAAVAYAFVQQEPE